MASTNFQDYNQNTPIMSSWLNDVNAAVYTAGGAAKKAAQSAAALVRFSVSGGVVTVQQSVNITSVVRVSAGVYTVTYSSPMTNATNSYGVSMNQAGFIYTGADSTVGVTIHTTDSSNAPSDPTAVSLQVFGAS
jgi:hypothetical protein